MLPRLRRKIDAVVTDPPYGTDGLADGYGRRQLHSKDGRTGRQIAGDADLSLFAQTLPLIAELISEGWLAAFFGARRTREFSDATAGLDWFGTVIWDKGRPGLGFHIRYAHEDIGIFRIGSPARPMKALMSVLRHTQPRSFLPHPHEKPLPIVEKLAEWCAPVGGTVLDPFMGSGTTGVACAQLGRRFVGIEIEPRYFEIACRRIEDAQRAHKQILKSAA